MNQPELGSLPVSLSVFVSLIHTNKLLFVKPVHRHNILNIKRDIFKKYISK